MSSTESQQPKNQKTKKQLTEVEFELMSILWDLGEGTVRQILDALPADRKMAYTSASTIVRILEKKEIVQSRPEGKSHVYRPLMSREDFASHSVEKLASGLFKGDAVDLVRCFFDQKPMTDMEKLKLKEMIDEF